MPTVLPVCVMVGTRSLSSGARARGPVALPTLRGISSFSHHCIITFLARPPMSGNRRAQARALTKEGSPVMHISRSSTSISKMRPNSSTSISAKNWRQHSVPSFRQTQARANDHRRPAVKPPAASRRATTASCGGPPTMRRALAARRDRRCRKGRAGSAPRPRGSMAASTSTMRRPLIAAMARIHCLMIAVPGPPPGSRTKVRHSCYSYVSGGHEPCVRAPNDMHRAANAEFRTHELVGVGPRHLIANFTDPRPGQMVIRDSPNLAPNETDQAMFPAMLVRQTNGRLAYFY